MLRRRRAAYNAEPLGPQRSGLTWVVANAPPAADDGYWTITFSELRSLVHARTSSRRATTDNPAAEALAVFSRHHRVALTGVPTRLNGDVRDLYNLAIEPAWRRDVDLLIEADRPLDALLDDALVEPELGYPWTLERLGYISARYHRVARDGLPPMTPIEERLYNAMRAAGLGPRVQYGIGKLRVDFAFPEVLLAVEADGRAWHDASRDERRDARLRRLGWEVIRFTGSEIVRDAAACASRISAVERRRQGEVRRTTDEIDAVKEKRSWWRRLLDWVTSRVRRQAAAGESTFEATAEQRSVPVWLSSLDEFQREAVGAPDGVVQVIAPAGSGKTRLIVARVQELRSRGAAANRILCCAFNRDAVAEMKARLQTFDEGQVEVRTFNGIGFKILEDAMQMRSEVWATTHAEWRYLAREAKKVTPDGVWIDPPEAQNAVSEFKLGRLQTPAEAEEALAAKLHPAPLDRTTVALYRLHEELLERQDRFDYDDLVFRAVKLLRDDPDRRWAWQRKFDFVLVDEYQDIDPAQERLVQLLAAPQDGLFCVGDEDQCIYAWRRAKVETIVDLDDLYPGLERRALGVNYRSGRAIVEASRALIEHNSHRFAKAIEPAPAAADGEVTVIQATSLDAQLREVARQAEDAVRGELVVLARTTNLLRQAAIALARRGLAVDAPAGVISDSGPNGLLVAYLRLFADLGSADPDDVIRVFRVPNRYLPDQAAEVVAARLRAGAGFVSALEGAERGEEWRVKRLAEAGQFFDQLATIGSAEAFIYALRTEGGLDRHYAEQQRLTPHDQSSIDLLESAERRAAGMTVTEFADVLDHETQLIKTHLNPETGLELRTIHGAKGREWPTVYVVGFDEGELPHRQALSDQGVDIFKAIEAERRLAYVAMTRARNRLVLLCSQGSVSRFIYEAALRPVVLERDAPEADASGSRAS